MRIFLQKYIYNTYLWACECLVSVWTCLLEFIYLKRISMSCNNVQAENVMDWIQFQMRESANAHV